MLAGCRALASTRSASARSSSRVVSTNRIERASFSTSHRISMRNRFAQSTTPFAPARKYATSTTSDPSMYNAAEIANRSKYANVLRLIVAYRRHGHLRAQLDPLGIDAYSGPVPELDLVNYGLEGLENTQIPLLGLINIPGKQTATVKEIVSHLKTVYCSNIGLEFEHIMDPVPRKWISDQVEALHTKTLTKEEKLESWKLMAEAEVFDHFMQKKFPFVKRYALEGAEAMVPAVNAIFQQASSLGINDVVIAMPHRGRLNLLTGMLRYPARDFFWKVKGNSELPEGTIGIGDVLSHIGQSVDLDYSGKPLHISLLQNPSHLEAGNPVAMGKIRARQTLSGNPDQHLNLTFHGDAAFYGQGVVAETIGLAKLPTFSVGGTVHMIVNNQLGFTTPSVFGRSSRYSADIGKILDIPVIHVNADCPEEVVKVARLAVEYRMKFKHDVIIDLIGYRRHGHNELDEPSFTQPIMYKHIRERKSIIKLYGDQLEKSGILSAAEREAFKQKLDAQLDKELAAAARPTTYQHLEGRWKGFVQARDITQPVATGVSDVNLLKSVGLGSVKYPASLKIHDRLQRTYVKSREEAINKDALDWATAEAMAFGTLLLQGYNVRLCGQDSGRGTFSQRHAELVDQTNESRYVPLNHLESPASQQKGQIQIVNSSLSELAVMGFEYGYASEDPRTLNIWEAQFGDFANGAQIMIDQFIASGEAKWLKQNGLVLLLPHGYDGAGPEHSSARLERFLQLTDVNTVDIRDPRNLAPNMRVINPTTPANYFHALRRQVLTNYRKPLIVMAPKTLLRHAKAVSQISELSGENTFQPVIDDTEVSPSSVNKVIFTSGKFYFDLITERAKQNITDTAIVRIEELVPFPVSQVESVLDRYNNARSVAWVQDESMNAGAWSFVQPIFNQLLSNSQIQYVGRPSCPASAVGITTAHNAETKQLLVDAFAI